MTTIATLPLPIRPEDVTPEWMTAVLSPHCPGVEVTAVRVIDIMAATATKLRVALTYNEAGQAAGLPATLIIKGPFGKNVSDMEWTFTHEMLAYRDLVSDIGINTPKCYLAEKQGQNPVLVLEDLAGPACQFGDPARPFTYDQAASVLASLAGLHARYWQDPELADDGALGWVLRSVSGWHLDYLRMVLKPENWAFYLGLLRGETIPRERAPTADRMVALMEKQWAHHAKGPLTLGHGDAHCANVYFNDKGGGLIDWEMRRCPWYHDVTYFLVSSLAVEDRRQWERPLIAEYLEHLASHGIEAPGIDKAFRDYRREILYGYLIFITNGDGEQFWSEADNVIVVERFARAADDHGSFALIEADE